MRTLPEWTTWLLGVFVLILAAGLFLPVIPFCGPIAEQVEARNATAILVVALQQYQNEYHVLPGGDYPAVLRELSGDNPRKLVFWERSRNKKRWSKSGCFLDPWGSPYRIDLSNPQGPRVHSSGKNRKDEPDPTAGSDDVCSWR